MYLFDIARGSLLQLSFKLHRTGAVMAVAGEPLICAPQVAC